MYCADTLTQTDYYFFVGRREPDDHRGASLVVSRRLDHFFFPLRWYHHSFVTDFC